MTIGHLYDLKMSALLILITIGCTAILFFNILIRKQKDVLHNLLVCSLIIYIICLIKFIYFPLSIFKETHAFNEKKYPASKKTLIHS